MNSIDTDKMATTIADENVEVTASEVGKSGRMARVRKLWCLLAVSMIAVLVPSAPAQAAPPYPATPPDFSHQGSPHSGDYSFAGGRTDRPILVIYLLFNDVTAPSGRDAAWLADRFFGPFPSVADYFADDSFGQLIFTPAQERNTASNGAVNDGVVAVDMGDKATYFTNNETTRNRMAVDAANATGVDFSIFDTNNDGTIRNRELVVEIMEEDANMTGGCGIARGVGSGGQLDGKNVGFSVAMDNTATNLITIIHETGHLAFNMDDFYGFGVGRLDLAGPTCGPPDSSLFRTSAWQRMHLGWSAPVVVTRDGFREVNAVDFAGESFILYDPDAGTDRYYMVEHRIRQDGTYDQDAADTGLVIWKIDDSLYDSPDQFKRPIELARPDGIAPGGCDSNGNCYGGSATDAWNPADMNTPQRTFDPSGGPNVAVRAINAPRGNGIVRVFFDVRGAGVLVDPNTPQGVPMTINVTPSEQNAITFPVMNTGDDIDGSGGMTPTDTFDFSVRGLPAGWSTSTHSMTLTDHQGAMANVVLTPDANAPTGITPVQALGASQTNPAVIEGSPFQVNVVLDPTELIYNGLASSPTGEGAGFSALVRNPGDAGTPPIPGETVTFDLSGPGGTLSATGITNLSGVATADPSLSVPPGTYDLTVSVPRLGKHAPASVTTSYTVERRPTTLTYTGDTSGQYSDPSTVSARLTDTLNGSLLPGLPLTLSLGTQSAPGMTDADGRSSAVITVTQPSGTVDAGAAFDGNTTYLPTTVTEPFSIAKEVLSFAYTGDTLTQAPGVPTLRSAATEEADGTPGDLSLAGARFDLAPTLTATPFDYTTGVDAAGLSSTPATGLPVDLWNVSISVPASNPFWTGSTAAPTEVAVFDATRNISGDARGRDSASSEVRAKLENIRFHEDGTWHNRTRFEGSFGRFVGEVYDFVIAVGNQAILQVDGQVGAVPATLRLRLTDLGSSGDTYRGQVSGIPGPAYDSGLVTASKGNLTVQQAVEGS